MAEETKNVHEQEVPKVVMEESSAATGEVTDRGMFDFLKKKKEETKPEETINSEFEQKVQVSEPVPEVKHEEAEKKPSLLEKLHRSDSSSSSSSEEEGEDGEKRKKKKKDKKKIATEGEVQTEEAKKGFMDKLKEKLPGHGKKPEDDSAVAAAPVVAPPVEEAHPAEKKGILEKIKEKLPGYHSKTVEEEKKDDH
ncbi:hypothetical protein BRARA_G02195 [Brassica rapa]|uniref:Dehydrin n=2 Tax=Brassica TaxID=3705 RepID=A0A397YQA9_BRACM|nr:dehydrin ERD14 [Brassica rapa]XP_013648768.1 dehydrin ERD14 [Brassica napus]KAH0919248.1 hypothetical protein HID58_026908 [Brassica napus]RID54908.1 hypothetical protein BRARA_G02195 [Brassica rapa]CAF2180606.1 unnamed protein product [Brassica napus]CAG7903418.1 unnamed protein product [Brassica rapa]